MPHDPARWGIIGFSEGGTCAVILTLVHPHEFTYFVDIGGDAGPSLGDTNNTLSALFGGSTAARDAHEPTLLLAAHRYNGITAWFVAGTADAGPHSASLTLAAAMRAAGGTVHQLSPAGGHSWKLSADTLRQLTPELYEQLGPG
jgi:S-formylglutathione hydrolase FrmB